MFLQLFWWSMWGGAGGKQHQWAECMYWCLSCGKPMAACTAALFGFDERQVGALFGGVKVVLSWDLPLCVCCYFFFLSWPFHVRQRAPNTVSHSCAMSACESQGECHWLFCATYGIYRFNLLHSGDQLELRWSKKFVDWDFSEFKLGCITAPLNLRSMAAGAIAF